MYYCSYGFPCYSSLPDLYVCGYAYFIPTLNMLRTYLVYMKSYGVCISKRTCLLQMTSHHRISPFAMIRKYVTEALVYSALCPHFLGCYTVANTQVTHFLCNFVLIFHSCFTTHAFMRTH